MKIDNKILWEIAEMIVDKQKAVFKEALKGKTEKDVYWDDLKEEWFDYLEEKTQIKFPELEEMDYHGNLT